MPWRGISANLRGHEDRWPRLGSCDADGATQARCGGSTVGRKPDVGGGGAGGQPAHAVSLAGAVWAWRLASVGRAQAWWASAQARRPRAALGLQHPDQQEPAAAEVSVRAVDRGDGSDTDRRTLPGAAEPQFGVPIAAPAWAERPAPAVAGVSTEPGGGEALAGDGISRDPAPGAARGRADLLCRRGRRALGLPQRHDLGPAGADP